MARIRTIKPGFWQHEDLSELPPEVHMMAAALLNHSDDEGYFKANDKLVKAACCPLREDSVSTHGALIQLEKIGFIEMFEGTDGKKYGHVVKFLDHQTISRPTASKIKKLQPLTEDSLNTHGVLHEDSMQERKGKEGKGKEGRDARERLEPENFKPMQADNLVPANWLPDKTDYWKNEAEKFVAHYAGKDGTPHTDWRATWNLWRLRAPEFAPAKPTEVDHYAGCI